MDPHCERKTIDHTDGDTKFRLLIVCQHFYPESFRINEIAFSLAERGWAVDVLCGMPNYPRGKYYPGYNYFHPRKEQIRGLTIYRVGEIPQWKKLGNIAVSMNYLYFPPAAILNLPRILTKKYDVVFLYSLTPVFMSLPGIIFAKIKKIPSLIYIMDYWPDSLYSVIPIHNRLLKVIFNKISCWHYRHCDRVLTPSKSLQKKVVDSTHINPSKSAFLPQSCEAFYEKLEHNKELHEKYDGRFNLVFAGNIGPAQSLEVLITTAKRLQEVKTSRDWRFILIGDGMSRLSLQAAIEADKLGDRIVFEGYKPAEMIPEYHEIADALFVSLAADPLFDLMIPAKIQSYMAAGKPILAVLSGEGAEIIKESGSGLVSEPDNPDALADNLVKLISMDQSQLQQMGQSGSDYYQKHFRHDIIMNRLEAELYACMNVDKSAKQ